MWTPSCITDGRRLRAAASPRAWTDLPLRLKLAARVEGAIRGASRQGASCKGSTHGRRDWTDQEVQKDRLLVSCRAGTDRLRCPRDATPSDRYQGDHGSG